MCPNGLSNGDTLNVTRTVKGGDVLGLSLCPLRFWQHWAFARRLASDSIVRANSLDGHVPTFWRHLRWMWRWSQWPWGRERTAWVVMASQPTKQLTRAVGIVRLGFDRELGAFEVHIALVPWMRGQDVGTRVLRHVATHANDDFRLIAHIKNGNPGSMRAFEKAGFSPVWFEDGVTRLEYQPVKVQIGPNSEIH